jgi:hypothetical protein
MSDGSGDANSHTSTSSSRTRGWGSQKDNIRTTACRKVLFSLSRRASNVSQRETTVPSNIAVPVRSTNRPRNPDIFRQAGIRDFTSAANSSAFPGRIPTFQTLAYMGASGRGKVQDGLTDITFVLNQCKLSRVPDSLICKGRGFRVFSVLRPTN